MNLKSAKTRKGAVSDNRFDTAPLYNRVKLDNMQDAEEEADRSLLMQRTKADFRQQRSRLPLSQTDPPIDTFHE